MTIKKKVAIGILTTVCGAMLLLSLALFLQASSGNLRPEIVENFEKSTGQVIDYSPATQHGFFAMKWISSLIFSLSIGLLIVLYEPFKRNLKWASVSIFTPLMLFLISTTWIVSIYPPAPWQMFLALLILVVIALMLTLSEKNRST